MVYTYGKCATNGVTWNSIDGKIRGRRTQPVVFAGYITSLSFYLKISQNTEYKLKGAIYEYLNLGDAGELLGESEEESRTSGLFGEIAWRSLNMIDKVKIESGNFYFICVWASLISGTSIELGRDSDLTTARNFVVTTAYDGWLDPMAGETANKHNYYNCCSFVPYLSYSGRGYGANTP